MNKKLLSPKIFNSINKVPSKFISPVFWGKITFTYFLWSAGDNFLNNKQTFFSAFQCEQAPCTPEHDTRPFFIVGIRCRVVDTPLRPCWYYSKKGYLRCQVINLALLRASKNLRPVSLSQVTQILSFFGTHVRQPQLMSTDYRPFVSFLFD